MATRSFKDKRVGLDCSNGSASSIAKSVFDALGAKKHIHSEPDGTNINRGCGSTHIEALQEFVKEKKLDVGFAYDGDADRCLAVVKTEKLWTAISFICLRKIFKRAGTFKQRYDCYNDYV